jgi:NAD(P)-dependent dehydrogenase (short-subunit alcohol dehydrogenase family)
VSMRVLVVGATGVLGRALVAALASGRRPHDVVQASRTAGCRVDIQDPDSIETMYEALGMVDAVACTAGFAPTVPIDQLTLDDVRAGLSNKLLGQVELVRRGLGRVTDGGSFTLVSGVTAYDPIRGGAVLSAVNAAVDGFVRGAAIDLPRGHRINSVSATLFAESVDAFGSDFPGFPPVPVTTVAQAFVKSIEGAQTGQTYRVGY